MTGVLFTLFHRAFLFGFSSFARLDPRFCGFFFVSGIHYTISIMRSSRLDRTALDAFNISATCHENTKLLIRRSHGHGYCHMPFVWWALIYICLALGMVTYGLVSNGRFYSAAFLWFLCFPKWLVFGNTFTAAIWLLLPSP
jgi:hypothetical protein